MLETTAPAIPPLGSVTSPATQSADTLVVGLTAAKDQCPSVQQIDKLSDGWLSRLIQRGQVRSKLGELTLLASPLAEGPTMILVVGLGEAQLTRTLAFDSAAAAIRRLADRSRQQVIIALGEVFPAEMHDAVVAGVVSGCEVQAIYQSDPQFNVPEQILFAATSDQAIQTGDILGQSINLTRRLVNEPAAVVYPESFAAKATEVAGKTGLQIEVWDEKRLESEGCRAILAVGAGSARPPRLVILRHQGGGDEPPLALVGKGVTFDSGGLSLKPSDGMVDMKCDMAGAATVLGAMHAIAALGIRRNVIGLCGLAENMISGTSYKLGDVIETRSGKTIEILNTDAEGRVVLADTLDVAIQHQPAAMIDLATLTGACMVALGNDVAGLMTNDQAVCDSLSAAADDEGERVWQLPMFDLYDEKIKSKVADIKNVGEGRWAGAITAAKFLENFVGDVPWVHIDIAGPAFADSPKPHRDAGGTGVMVRTLVRWVQQQT